jgi:hypothetical protein
MRLLLWLVFVLALVAGTARPRADVPGGIAAATPSCDPARPRCVRIRLHIALDADKPVVTPEWFAAQLASANTHFAAADIAFELAGVDALPASALDVVTRRDRNALAAGRDSLGGGVIHVYLVGTLDDVDVPGEARNGVAWRRPGDNRKYVILASRARAVTLAHELGHVFGLPHSTHPISIMNKTPRDEPPMEQRTFAPEELVIVKKTADRLIRTKVIHLRAAP